MIVQAKELTKEYQLGKTSVKALYGVTLNIEKGDFMSIVGPSGSGKTTLLNILGCIDKPDSGELIIDGKNIDKLSDDDASVLRLYKIGFIFQTFNLVPVLNVFENVEFPLMLTKVKAKERNERVKEILNHVGLSQYLKHKPDELSGGQRQRVAISRALITNPSIVLADEPTANLDSKTGEMIIKLMLEMNKESGITFIFSTHDRMVMEHARKKVFLHDGSIEKIEE